MLCNCSKTYEWVNEHLHVPTLNKRCHSSRNLICSFVFLSSESLSTVALRSFFTKKNNNNKKLLSRWTWRYADLAFENTSQKPHTIFELFASVASLKHLTPFCSHNTDKGSTHTFLTEAVFFIFSWSPDGCRRCVMWFPADLSPNRRAGSAHQGSSAIGSIAISATMPVLVSLHVFTLQCICFPLSNKIKVKSNV